MVSSLVVRAATRSLVPSIRRSTTAANALAKQQYSTSAISLGGATPPLSPFARLPVESEKLVEQYVMILFIQVFDNIGIGELYTLNIFVFDALSIGSWSPWRWSCYV